VTTEIQGALGIAGGYPRGIDIEHNEISYTNYTGISVGFGWTKTANAMTGNKINWNNIHHVEQLLADAGEIYTLSNQGSGSQIQYNYLHDISASTWADYWICAIYLDEGSSGFDVSHNVQVNAPKGVACNSCGSYTQSDNDGTAASTISGAGIEPAYSDIKNKLTIPLPVFGGTTAIAGRTASTATPRFNAEFREGRLLVRSTGNLSADDGIKSLSVYGLDGHRVANYGLGGSAGPEWSVDFSREPVGNYFAVLQSDNARSTVQFVKP